MQKILPLLALCLVSVTSSAQTTRFIVKFTNKAGNPFSISNPSQYLSPRALQRRARYNIGIDSTDLPITPRYLDSIRAAGAVTVLNTSKWLNQVLIKTSDIAALNKINSFPFVKVTEPIGAVLSTTQTLSDKMGITENVAGSFVPSEPDNLLDHYNYGRSNGQVKIHRGDFLHNRGFRGEGMHMAVLDGGFFNYKTLRPFDSIRLNNQVLGTWDFVANEESVNEDNKHGMHCLSTIAANVPGVFVGTAPKTSFYLFRTEDVFTEYPVEEQNWAAGIERADSLGVDICSTSLGYYQFSDPTYDYTYSDMDGNTTLSAQAADLASKKGMLLLVSNGNEGTSPWHYMITPADADSVLSVGAVDTLGNIAAFSSYGPSSDGQVKPSLASIGLNAIVASSSTGAPIYGNGTSFACPNLAGITSCLWQAFPEVNNMAIIQSLQSTASKSTAPDDRVGYGIPNAKRAFVTLVKQLFTQQSTMQKCLATLNLEVKMDSSMTVTIERKLPTENQFTPLTTRQGNGSFRLQDISMTDDLASSTPGNVQYRFQMDMPGDSTFYLDSLMVNLIPNCADTVAKNDVWVGPNPVVTNLTITFKRQQAATYQVIAYNNRGQRLKDVKGQAPRGTSTIEVPMQEYSAGVYYITVFINQEKVVTQKIIKQ